MLFPFPTVAQEEEISYPYSILFLNFKDLSSDDVITAIPASITFINLDIGTRTSITRFLDAEGTSRYQLRPGNWEIEIKADSQQTPEMDYYGKHLLYIDERVFVTNKSLYLTPVGALEGIVIDKSQNRISGAAMQFKCKSNGKIEYPKKTDEFGSFSVAAAPVGNCKITAAYQGKVGTEDVKIVQGELSNVVVNLDKSLVSSSTNLLYISVAIFILSALFVVFSYRYLKYKFQKQDSVAQPQHSHRRQEEKALSAEKEKKVFEEGQLNPRARDIMKTLKDTESKVAEFLLNNNFAATQAKIRNATYIPKTTLARVLQSLEEKKVLKIDKIGKMKKIMLTEWFLGKE